MTALSRDAAIDLVLPACAGPGPRSFYLGVVGYYIEGLPYQADGLTVGFETTPNLVATPESLTCDAWFPPTHLEGAVVRAKGIVRADSGVDLVQVILEVKRRDIWMVAEFIGGVQDDLFVDPDALVTRKQAFARETAAWRGSTRPGLQ
jgi:hypothetical protein